MCDTLPPTRKCDQLLHMSHRLPQPALFLHPCLLPHAAFNDTNSSECFEQTMPPSLQALRLGVSLIHTRPAGELLVITYRSYDATLPPTSLRRTCPCAHLSRFTYTLIPKSVSSYPCLPTRAVSPLGQYFHHFRISRPKSVFGI